MRTTINANPAPPVLAPDDWLNVVWVTSRVMAIVGHPPAVISVEDSGTPGVMWVDPEEAFVVVVLDYEDNPARLAPEAAKMTMHISERLTEGVTLALIGLCTMRDVLWNIIPAGSDDPEEDDELELKPETETS